jgi:hypothetical protein
MYMLRRLLGRLGCLPREGRLRENRKIQPIDRKH